MVILQAVGKRGDNSASSETLSSARAQSGVCALEIDGGAGHKGEGF